jgi:hypothetical protein
MLTMDPNFVLAHLDLGDGYAGKSMYSEAVAEWEKFGIMSGQNPEELATLKEAFLKSGIDGYRRKQLEQLEQRTNEHRHVFASNVAELHALLGNREQALAWLYKAYEERDFTLILLKVRPGYDSLRSDPRFIALLRNMGLDKRVVSNSEH